MSDLVDYVDATYNGGKHRFQLHRNHLPAFEAALGDSAFAAMKRFVDGEWRYRDVELTLSFAHSGASDAENKISDLVRKIPVDLTEVPMMHQTEFTVRRVLRDRGPALYAELAANILIAALMGLEPENAVFDDGSMSEAAA